MSGANRLRVLGVAAAVLIAVGVTVPAMAEGDQDFVGAYATTVTHQGPACAADGKATLDIPKITADTVSVSIGGGDTPYAFDAKTATFSGRDPSTETTINGSFKRESGRLIATLIIAVPDQCTTTLTGPRTGAVAPKPTPTLVDVPVATLPGGLTESTSTPAGAGAKSKGGGGSNNNTRGGGSASGAGDSDVVGAANSANKTSDGGSDDGPPVALLIGALGVVGALGVGVFTKSRTRGGRLLGQLATACAARLTASRTLRERQGRLAELDAAIASRHRAAHLQQWWAQLATARATLISPVAVLPETRAAKIEASAEELTISRALASRAVTESQAAFDAARAEVERLEAEARELRMQIPTCADPYEYAPMEVA